MRALTNNYSLDETVIRTINAGTDLLLFNTNMWEDHSLVQYLTDLISENVQNGVISEATINRSYDRIMKLKEERIPTSTDQIADQSAMPDRFEIRNYPNPFNPATNITVSLLRPEEASVSVYNVAGQRVQIIHEGQLSRGVHTFRFDGSSLSSGVYYVVARTGQQLQTHPMMLIK